MFEYHLFLHMSHVQSEIRLAKFTDQKEKVGKVVDN